MNMKRKMFIGVFVVAILLVLSACGGSAPVEAVVEMQEPTYTAYEPAERAPLSQDEARQAFIDIVNTNIWIGLQRGDVAFVSYEVSGIGHGILHIGIAIGENDYNDTRLRSVAATHASNISEALLNEHDYLDDYWRTFMFTVYELGTAIRFHTGVSFDEHVPTFRTFGYDEFFDDFNFDFNPAIWDELMAVAGESG
jgi:hypothetical protein